MDRTTINIVGPTLLHPHWLWCLKGCNNSQQCWDLQCTMMGRVQLIRLWRPWLCNACAWPQQCWESCANRSSIVALRFRDQRTEKCWELFAQKFDQFRALSNNNLQHATGCANECNMKHSMFNVRSCWPTMLHLFVRGFTVEAVLRDTLVSGQLYSQPPSQNLFFSTPIQTLY